MTHKILGSTWFSNLLSDHIGIVVIKNFPAEEEKAYIGNGLGFNKEADEEMIAKFGGPFPIKEAKKLCKLE